MLQSKCIARHLKCACVSWCSWSMNRLRIKSPCEVSVWSVEIFRCGDLIYSFRSEIPCSTVGCFFFCCCFCSVCILSTLLFLKKCFFHFVLGFSWLFCMAFGFRSAKQNPKKNYSYGKSKRTITRHLIDEIYVIFFSLCLNS